jgi:hypothetical protein
VTSLIILSAGPRESMAVDHPILAPKARESLVLFTEDPDSILQGDVENGVHHVQIMSSLGANPVHNLHTWSTRPLLHGPVSYVRHWPSQLLTLSQDTVKCSIFSERPVSNSCCPQPAAWSPTVDLKRRAFPQCGILHHEKYKLCGI